VKERREIIHIEDGETQHGLSEGINIRNGKKEKDL